MKKRTKTYVLLSVVIVVWAIIGYKVISALNPDEPNNQEIKSFKTAFNPTIQKERDTFSIQPVRKDPFLGTLLIKPEPKKITRSTVKTKKVKWPMVKYQGLVSKMSSKRDQVYIVTINRVQYLAKKGQIIDSIKVVNGNENQVVLRYKNELKTISL